MRILRAAEGARPMLMGFASRRGRRRLRRRDHRLAASSRSRSNTWTGRRSRSARPSPMPAIRSTSRRCSSSRSKGSEAEIADLIGRITAIAERFRPADACASRSRRPRAPRSGRAASPPSAPWAGSPTISAWTASSRPAGCRRCCAASREICAGYGLAGRQHLPRRRRQPASADPLQRQRPGRAGEGRAGRRRHPEALRRGRRLPDRRAWRRRREARPDARSSSRRSISTQQMRVKSVFDPAWLLNPAKVFPLDGRPVPA